jgi:uncharacterized membrane protein YdbT with pleckstrin-like domain
VAEKLPVDLQPREHVLLIARRHPVYTIMMLVAEALAAIVPAALVLWLLLSVVDVSGIFRTISIIVVALWLLYWLVQMAFVWYHYRHDLWIITNQRILDLYRKNPFNQSLSSADLVNVQDISVSRSGLLATIFKFGDVRCQTAGTNASFTLSGVPNPNSVLATIDAARDRARLENARGELPGGMEDDTSPRADLRRPADAAVPDSVPRTTLPDSVPHPRPPDAT